MSKLFFGGVPTQMDVEKLMQFGPEPGTSISYEEVSAAIGVTPKESRFRTVTTVWRKRLFREKMVQTAAYGGAFHFLTANEAHDQSISGVTRVGRMVGRLRVKVEAVRTDDLSGERRDKHNLLRREAQAIHEAIQSSAKMIAAPTPVAGSALRIAKA